MSRPPRKEEPPFMKDGFQTRVPVQPRTGRETRDKRETPPFPAQPGPQDNVVNPSRPGPGPFPQVNPTGAGYGTGTFGSGPYGGAAKPRGLGEMDGNEARSAIASDFETVIQPPSISVRVTDKDPRLEGSAGLVLDGEPGLDGGPSNLSEASDAIVATAHGRPKRAATKKVVIRNKAQATVQSRILIAALQEALDFKPTPGDNRIEPELRSQLNLADPNAHALFNELLVELKKLNSFLEANRKATKLEKRVVGPLSKVGLKVLKTYGNTVAVGAGLLTIGALCSVLNDIGAHQIVENAMIWKKVGR